MNDINFLDKIKKKRFYLNKIVANRINKNPEDETININQDTNYKILENNSVSLVIKVGNTSFVEPEALFSIELEYVIEYAIQEEIDEEEINANINEIIRPLGSEISYMIASITKEMLGSHLILPPEIAVSDIKEK